MITLKSIKSWRTLCECTPNNRREIECLSIFQVGNAIRTTSYVDNRLKILQTFSVKLIIWFRSSFRSNKISGLQTHSVTPFSSHWHVIWSGLVPQPFFVRFSLFCIHPLLDICITSPKDVHSREFDGGKERGIKVFVCVVGNYA